MVGKRVRTKKGCQLLSSRLPRTARSRRSFAWAIAVAGDIDTGQLGDGNDRDNGVKSDAEIDILVSILIPD